MNAPDWAARAATLRPDGRALIGGERRAATDGAVFGRYGRPS